MKGTTRVKQFCLATMLFFGMLLLSSYSHAASTKALSIGFSGEVGTAHGTYVMSDDGRFIAFDSYSDTLVPGDTNNHLDVFVSDALTGAIERVSVDSAGNERIRDSSHPIITADGRYVFFGSVGSFTLDCPDVSHNWLYVHDRLTHTTECLGNIGVSGINADATYFVYVASEQEPSGRPGPVPTTQVYALNRMTGEITLVSSDSNGNKGNDSSYLPSISADGRYVAFDSRATNLIPNDIDDGPNVTDIFVKDLLTGSVEKVSADATATLENYLYSYWPSISADGRYVAFTSYHDIYPKKKLHLTKTEVFIYDRQTQATEQVDFTSIVNGHEYGPEYPDISGNGRYVAFSVLNRLLPYPNSSGLYVRDLFRLDRQTGDIVYVSVDSSGNLSNNDSQYPVINADGRFVIFRSAATNLVEGVTAPDALYLRDSYDIDNDTYGDDVDCNDLDADIFPGAPELCKDHLDNDCDGLIDREDPDCGGNQGALSHNKIK